MCKVTKSNRRLTMAACLVLAYKFNEPMTISGTASKLPALWTFIDSEVCTHIVFTAAFMCHACILSMSSIPACCE